MGSTPCLASCSKIVTIRDENLDDIPICVAKVPEYLTSLNPESYFPKMFGVGPFHHDRLSLEYSETHKASEAVKYFDQYFLFERSFTFLTEQVQALARKIRTIYSSRLKIDNTDLSRMLTIDALFLCSRLLNASALDDNFLRDAMMLENQMPIFVLKKVLEVQFPLDCDPSGAAEIHLRRILWGCVTAAYPLANPPPPKNVSVNHGHMLGLLYDSLTGGKEDSVKVTWSFTGAFDRFVTYLIPNPQASPPKIKIPTASKLVNSGVKLVAAMPGRTNIRSIGFFRDSAALHLPAVKLGPCSDVVIRNLVAYEQYLIESRQPRSRPSFTSYLELMKGLMPTEDDVRLLKSQGILIVHESIGDGDVARLFETRVGSAAEKRGPETVIDKAVREASEYSLGYWRVHSRKILNKSLNVTWNLFRLVFFFSVTVIFGVSIFCSMFEACGSNSIRTTYTSLSTLRQVIQDYSSSLTRSCT